MKSKETVYSGVIYRSRLEAKWAIFFDVIGIKFQYEPRQFNTRDGLYLPDFFLPELSVWVEIKPGTIHGPEPEEIRKMEDVAKNSGQLGIIFRGFPKRGDQSMPCVMFFPKKQHAKFAVMLDCIIDDIDVSFFVDVAVSTVDSRMNNLFDYTPSTGVFKMFLMFGMIDRYRHNKQMQINNAAVSESTRSSKNDYFAPFRQMIVELKTAFLNRIEANDKTRAMLQAQLDRLTN